jgi:hypothetical protein
VTNSKLRQQFHEKMLFMKELLCLIILIYTHNSVAASECQTKVLGHYQDQYHRTYKAASNTFLNNFVGRKNTKAHVLGYPQIAFLGMDNFIANNMIEKSGKEGIVIYRTYMHTLETGELCQDLGKDYQSFGKVRAYLLEKLKEV